MILRDCGDPGVDWEESPALTLLNALRRPSDSGELPNWHSIWIWIDGVADAKKPGEQSCMAASYGSELQDVLVRIQGEFLEMPGLCLTPEEACRLWRLDVRSCEEALDALVDARFLARTRDGAFVRHDGNSPKI